MKTNFTIEEIENFNCILFDLLDRRFSILYLKNGSESYKTSLFSELGIVDSQISKVSDLITIDEEIVRIFSNFNELLDSLISTNNKFRKFSMKLKSYLFKSGGFFSEKSIIGLFNKEISILNEIKMDFGNLSILISRFYNNDIEIKNRLTKVEEIYYSSGIFDSSKNSSLVNSIKDYFRIGKIIPSFTLSLKAVCIGFALCFILVQESSAFDFNFFGDKSNVSQVAPSSSREIYTPVDSQISGLYEFPTYKMRSYLIATKFGMPKWYYDMILSKGDISYESFELIEEGVKNYMPKWYFEMIFSGLKLDLDQTNLFKLGAQNNLSNWFFEYVMAGGEYLLTFEQGVLKKKSKDYFDKMYELEKKFRKSKHVKSIFLTLSKGVENGLSNQFFELFDILLKSSEISSIQISGFMKGAFRNVEDLDYYNFLISNPKLTLEEFDSFSYNYFKTH